MKYDEYLYNVCKDTNLKDEEDVTATMQFLAQELKNYHDFAMKQDEKLKEIMTAKDYAEWKTEVGKELFRRQVEDMEDGDFKNFCLENWDKITVI